jgi:glucokinase
LNLDMFVLGGGVSSAWDAYGPAMFDELRVRSLVYAATAPADPLMMMHDPSREAGASAQTESRTSRKTIVTVALLGSDAGLYGAARVAVLPG